MKFYEITNQNPSGVVGTKPALVPGSTNKYTITIGQPFTVVFTLVNKTVPKGQGGSPTLTWTETTNTEYLLDPKTGKYLVPANQATELTQFIPTNKYAAAVFKPWTTRSQTAGNSTPTIYDMPGIFNIPVDKDGEFPPGYNLNYTYTNTIVIKITNPNGCSQMTLTKTVGSKIIFKNANPVGSPPTIQ